jgi:hypothetical protein
VQHITVGVEGHAQVLWQIDLVCSYALEYSQMGYKRFTCQMIDDKIAYLRPYQAYEILKERDLLSRFKNGASKSLHRPPEPDHPD